jgi:hypothetical protein
MRACQGHLGRISRAFDARSSFWLSEGLRWAPTAVLIDDAGFGNPSTFGGPIATPNYDRMAAQGLRYNRFHVTAMCSPTRADLLTGRNHHAVGGRHTGVLVRIPWLLGHAAQGRGWGSRYRRLTSGSTACRRPETFQRARRHSGRFGRPDLATLRAAELTVVPPAMQFPVFLTLAWCLVPRLAGLRGARGSG